jgi:hypothetical protein
VNSAVCTLFEGSYHYGLAGLANSLHRCGYRGRIYAGYRGALPPWAHAAQPAPLPGWPLARALGLGEDAKGGATGGATSGATGGPTLIFLPLTTTHHLTNHKPEFMLALLDGAARDAQALFYVDPDICVTAPWKFFEDWVGCGVALCEDLNSPLPEHHPRRVGWRRHYAPLGLALRYRAPEYVNGGFVGVRAQDRPFLELWKRAMDGMADEIGSLATAKVGAGQAFKSTGFAGCFDCSDQDALNVAIEATELAVSVIGQEAMAFKPGAALLPHAVGAGKPWQRSYLRQALQGFAPRQADKAFWANASAPIAAHGRLSAALKRWDIAAGAALGRVLRRV